MSLYIVPKHIAASGMARSEAGIRILEPGPEIAPPGPLHLSFQHGLGDCVHFAVLLQLYLKRSYRCVVRCEPGKSFIFRLAGLEVDRESSATDFLPVPWHDSHNPEPGTIRQVWNYNKVAINLGTAPLPKIGSLEALWPELCAVRLPVIGGLSEDDVQWAEQLVQELPRPIFLLHTRGRSYQRTKNIPDDTVLEAYRHLLDRSEGTVIPLDMDRNMPTLAHARVRSVEWDSSGETTARLLALIRAADVVAAVDSGPLHLARFSRTPTVGLFPHADHFAPRFCLPRLGQINLVPAKQHDLNAPVRIAYPSVECRGPELSGSAIADSCLKALSPARYLTQELFGQDMQLQQFTREWTRGAQADLSPYVDRHNSYDVLLQEVRSRFSCPTIVETGCVRQAEDWTGAGYSTYLLGTFLQHHGGRLISVDHNRAHCKIARESVRELNCVEIVCRDSVWFLRTWDVPIDVLVLDSAAVGSQVAANYTLDEVIAAMHMLHERSLIVFDDTVWEHGRFHGRGAKAVPWLMNNGWCVLYSGYQTICVRDERS